MKGKEQEQQEHKSGVGEVVEGLKLRLVFYSASHCCGLTRSMAALFCHNVYLYRAYSFCSVSVAVITVHHYLNHSEVA